MIRRFAVSIESLHRPLPVGRRHPWTSASAAISISKSGQSAFGAIPGILESSSTPQAVDPAEEDDYKSSIPGWCRFATIASKDPNAPDRSRPQQTVTAMTLARYRPANGSPRCSWCNLGKLGRVPICGVYLLQPCRSLALCLDRPLHGSYSDSLFMLGVPTRHRPGAIAHARPPRRVPLVRRCHVANG
jgi:hypothetical protein